MDRIRQTWQLVSRFYPFWGVGAGALLLGLLSFVLGASALLLLLLPFLIGCALFLLLLLVLPGEGEDAELAALVRQLDREGRESVYELSRKIGLTPNRIEFLLERLLPSGLFTYAYFKPERTLYLFPGNGEMEHCPRCATDLQERAWGKCPNCRVVFSRRLGKKPYYYL